jgi:hypothetical protein
MKQVKVLTPQETKGKAVFTKKELEMLRGLAAAAAMNDGPRRKIQLYGAIRRKLDLVLALLP